MDNVITVDLLLAAALLIFVWRGARRGLVRSVMGLVSVLVALFGAALLSSHFARPVTDLVFPRVQEYAVSYLAQSGEGEVVSAADGGEEAQLPEELADAFGGLYDTLRRFGVSEEMIDSVTEGMTQSAVSAAERAAYALVESVVRAALYLVFFIALLLACRLLTAALHELCGLPILWQLNLLGGAALSLVMGVLLIYLVLYLAPRFGVTWFADHAEGTRLLAWFIDHTPYSILASLM